MEQKEEYTLSEVFSDNGEISHFRIIKNDTGENIFSSDENEDKAMGFPVSLNIDTENNPVAEEILHKLANIKSYGDWSELMFDSHDFYQIDSTIEAMEIFAHNKISKLKSFLKHKEGCSWLNNGNGKCSCGLSDLIRG